VRPRPLLQGGFLKKIIFFLKKQPIAKFVLLTAPVIASRAHRV
jgi:hypothetical protein